MLSKTTYALLLSAIACSPSSDAQAGDAGDFYGEATSEISSAGCTVVQGPTNGGSPPYRISPRSSIVSDFTRPVFPHFFRPGSWSSGQFVRDSNGLMLPAVTANGVSAGWMSLPFESGETVVGLSMTVCGDGTTALFADTWATRFTTDQIVHDQDYLKASGSGGTINSPPVWGVEDVTTYPMVLQQDSTLWLSISAIQLSNAVPTPPPSIAIAQIVLHVNR